MEKGEYHVRLLNNVGQLLSSMPLNHIGGTSMHTIVTKQKIISGIYNIEIKKGVGEKKILKVVIK